MTLRLGEISGRRTELRQDATEADGGGTAPTTVQQLGESNTSATPLEDHSHSENHEEPGASDKDIRSYLQNTLAKAKLFREELSSLYDPSKKHKYPPMVLISSTKTATVKGCLVDDEQEIIDGKYDRLLFGEGGKFVPGVSSCSAVVCFAKINHD